MRKRKRKRKKKKKKKGVATPWQEKKNCLMGFGPSATGRFDHL
jgi:hypothetical protein